MQLRSAIYKEYSKMDEVKRLIMKLEISEAVHLAMIGSTYDKRKRNQSAYNRWKNRIINRINKLLGKKTHTVWDQLTKSRRF